MTVDLTDEAAVRDATAQTEAAQGRIDILVNNAGITGGNAPTWELPVAEWRRVIEVNLIAPYLVSAAVRAGYDGARLWPGGEHRQRGRAKRATRMPRITARPRPGLIALTKSLGKELAGRGVLVNCITPAAAKTELFDQMTEAQIAYMLGKIPMGRFVKVEEIAALAAWLMSEECSFSTGAVFDITGGRSTY